MLEVLIADDEGRIRKGLLNIVDWKGLGYAIAGETADGEETLKFLLHRKPNIALIDINMPKMSGLDVIKRAYEGGYNGKIIILSGYSEFKFAQEAIKLGVDYYLTKPIDEMELERILRELNKQLEEDSKKRLATSRYFERARETILRDLMIDPSKIRVVDLFDMSVSPMKYKVVLCEEYVYHYGDRQFLFKQFFLTGANCTDIFESVFIGNAEAVLLKGSTAISKFEEKTKRYLVPDRHIGSSRMQNIFLSCGRTVSGFSDIHISYNDAKELIERRFFCKPNQHIIMYEERSSATDKSAPLHPDFFQRTAETLCKSISSFNRNLLSEALQMLELSLCESVYEISEVKYFLTDIYLKIKETISRSYNATSIPFPDNSWVMDFIQNRRFFYEIIHFFEEQFEMIMSYLGNYTKDSVLDDVLHYINHNYMNNLKLEEIAFLFGYNSSYLGKIFKRKMNMSFNTYLDKVRIDASKKLLENPGRKVYEVAEMVGYSNVNYFYVKFKKNVGESAVEYRKRNLKW